MKAVRLQARGGAEQLRYQEAPVPVPEPGYALVRVHATGITPAELAWPETWTSHGRPRHLPIPGHDEVGRVDRDDLAALVDAGRLRPIVSCVIPIAEARTAYEQGLAGHNRGKTVLTIT